jgi:hypothetical protein
MPDGCEDDDFENGHSFGRSATTTMMMLTTTTTTTTAAMMAVEHVGALVQV